MIDTHCHIDLYPNPHKVANYSEKNNIITIGVTNLPSHFELGFPHIQHFTKVRLALGMHPLYAERHQSEYDTFKKWVDKTSYIGEIGLDFTKEGLATKELQIQSFSFILEHLRGKKKFISLHSRKAENVILELLKQNEIPIAVFHWYSGSIGTLKQIIESGYYLSVNPAMLRSKNGRRIIEEIPKHLLLTESDGPFINVNGRESEPKDVFLVVEYLSKQWNLSVARTLEQIQNNFRYIISAIKN